MAKAVSSSCNCSYKWVLNIFRHQIFLNEYTNIFCPKLTCVKVVLCLRLAGVGQLEEAAWTDIPAESPSVFNFLNAPSINMYISSSHHSNFSHSTDWRGGEGTESVLSRGKLQIFGPAASPLDCKHTIKLSVRLLANISNKQTRELIRWDKRD